MGLMRFYNGTIYLISLQLNNETNKHMPNILMLQCINGFLCAYHQMLECSNDKLAFWPNQFVCFLYSPVGWNNPVWEIARPMVSASTCRTWSCNYSKKSCRFHFTGGHHKIIAFWRSTSACIPIIIMASRYRLENTNAIVKKVRLLK